MNTSNLRERVARAIEESLYGTERIGRTDTLQYGLEADAAINTMRPIIRAEVLEEAEAICREKQSKNKDAQSCAAAIRALKEKP